MTDVGEVEDVTEDVTGATDAAGTQYEVRDEGALRDRYRRPSEFVANKSRPRIDPEAAGFVGASPLMVLATSSASGTDASPRGGPPGFVKVLGPGHLAFADLSGNNRLDSYANIVERPHVGILFLVPGLEDTLRVNGRARVMTDPSVLDRTAIDGVRPKVAVVVDVDECYVHCAKALRRSGVWDTGTWLPAGERPSGVDVVADQFQLDADPAALEADLEVNYRETLWREGGR